MKLKLAQIISQPFTESFAKLMVIETLSGSMMFQLKKLLKQIKIEFAQYEELRNEYVDLYCEKDEQGNKVIQIIKNSKNEDIQTVKLQGDKVDLFNEKLAELNNIEIEFPEIKFSELGSNHKLSVNDLDVLEFITE